jgi:hypothetical protein
MVCSTPAVYKAQCHPLHEEAHSNQHLFYKSPPSLIVSKSFTSLPSFHRSWRIDSAGPLSLYTLPKHLLTSRPKETTSTFTMKNSIIALALIGAAVARPTAMKKREVPQEHAHENIVRAVNTLLQLDNPDNIQDAVFGLLGNAAGIKGAGNIADAGKNID